MTKYEEDALIERAIDECSTTLDVDWHGAIRLAIRAAVAAERERCARVCEKLMKVEPGFVQTFGNAATGYECAAAIRKGE